MNCNKASEWQTLNLNVSEETFQNVNLGSETDQSFCVTLDPVDKCYYLSFFDAGEDPDKQNGSFLKIGPGDDTTEGIPSSVLSTNSKTCWKIDKLKEQRPCAMFDEFRFPVRRGHFRKKFCGLIPSLSDLDTLLGLTGQSNAYVNMSSVSINSNVKVTLFKGENYTGESKVLTSDANNFGGGGFSNNVKSLKIEFL